MPDQPSDNRGEARQSYFVRQQTIFDARGVFQLLSAVLKNYTLYPESHPILMSAAEKLAVKIGELMVGRQEVSFYVIGGELFFEKLSVPVDQSLSLVLEQLTDRDAGGMSFRPGLQPEEIIRVAGLLNREVSFFRGKEGLSAMVAKEGIQHIELHRVMVVDKNVSTVLKEGKEKAAAIFKDAVEAVKDIVETARSEKGTNVRKMNTLVQNMVDNILENRDVYLGLTNIKMYDEYTFAHSVNVAILAVSLGTYLGLQKQQIAGLGMAGLMHDIGKVHVPHEIINKPGKLTDQEWEAVKRHPIEGALQLAVTPGVSKLAMVSAFEHHQHAVGGYPERQHPEQPPHPFSQIVSLADAYDAITAARVYYSTYTSPDQGVRILLKKRGKPFNSILVNAFVKMMGVFPIGTVVKLNTGQIGLVKQQTSDLMRPRVLLLTKFDGSEKDTGDVISLLDTQSGRYRFSIVGTINPSAARMDVKKYLT